MNVDSHDPTDEDILELLRNSLDSLPDSEAVDVAPPAVLDGAKWIFEWSNMDSQLADLAFDSQIQPELAGVRSTGSLRELTFVSEPYTIEMQVTAGAHSATVSGTIDPAVDGSIELLAGGEVFRGDIDTAGAFIVENVPAGTVLVFVELPARKIRLSSFEI